MGLFTKEPCIVCENIVDALNRKKLNNGTFLCGNCINKVGICDGFSMGTLKNSSKEQIEERIAYHEKDVKENAERISKFNATNKINNNIWFDDDHKWFIIPQGGLDNSYVFKYDEIINFEVLEDSITVTKGGLGKALVGGAIFGLAGAIVGGTSKRSNDVCNKLEIKITTRNHDKPVIYINLIDTEFKKNGWVYKTASKIVQEIISKLQIIMDELEQEKVINKENSNTSVADEIKKFKELLDIGAITQEEFDKKKKELLG